MDTPVLTPAPRNANTSQAAWSHLEPEAMLTLSVRLQNSEFWITDPKGPAPKMQAHTLLFPSVSKYIYIFGLKALHQWKEQFINDCYILSKA